MFLFCMAQHNLSNLVILLYNCKFEIIYMLVVWPLCNQLLSHIVGSTVVLGQNSVSISMQLALMMKMN